MKYLILFGLLLNFANSGHKVVQCIVNETKIVVNFEDSEEKEKTELEDIDEKNKVSFFDELIASTTLYKTIKFYPKYTYIKLSVSLDQKTPPPEYYS